MAIKSREDRIKEFYQSETKGRTSSREERIRNLYEKEKKTEAKFSVRTNPTNQPMTSKELDNDEDDSRLGSFFKGTARQLVGSNLSSIGTTLQSANPLDITKKLVQPGGFAKLAADEIGNFVTEKITGKEKEQSGTDKVFSAIGRNLTGKADQMLESGSADIEKSKEGLGTLGKFGIDVASQGLLMGSDALINAIAPGSGISAFYSRAAGYGASEARQAGATEDQQLLYGAASGLLEVGLEKVFSAGKYLKGMYGKGAIDLAEPIASKVATSKLVKGVAKSKQGQELIYQLTKMGVAANEEGIEEALSDIISPFLKRAVYSDEIEMPSAGEVLYDYMLGAASGGLFGAAGTVADYRSGVGRLNQMESEAAQNGTDVAGEAISRAQVQADKSDAKTFADQLQRQRESGSEILGGQVNDLARMTRAQQIKNDSELIKQKQQADKEFYAGDVSKISGEGSVTYYRAVADVASNLAKDESSFLQEIIDESPDLYVGMSGDSTTVGSIAKVVVGTATTEDIDRILMKPAAKELLSDRTGMEIPVSNAEARKSIESLVSISGATNRADIRKQAKVKLAEDLSQNLGTEGSKTFVSLYQNVADVDNEKFNVIFDRYYNAGTYNIGIADMDKIVSGMSEPYVEVAEKYFTPEVKNAIMKAGFADSRAETMRNEQSVIRRKKPSETSKKGVLRDESSGKLSAPMKTALEAFAHRTGVNVVFTDTLSGGKANGAYATKSEGAYINGTIYLAADSANPLITVAKHELTHHLKKFAPAEYQELEDFVFAEWYNRDKGAHDKAIQDKIDDYKKNGYKLTMAEAKEEILADAAESFFRDESAIDSAIEYSKKLGEAILDGIRSILDTFMAIRDGDSNRRDKGYGKFLDEIGILEEAQNKWMKALQASTKNDVKADDGKTKASIKQFEFSKAKALENMKHVTNMQPVSILNGTEFAKGPVDLLTQVTNFFDSLGNSVEHPAIGSVMLLREGIKSSIGHGVGRKKSIAFAALPDIIEKGVIIDAQRNWKGNSFDTVVIAAPIKIGANDEFYAGVVIRRDTHNGKQSYYLHELEVIKKNSMPSKTVATQTGRTHGGKTAPLMSLLQRLNDVNSLTEKDIVSHEGKFSIKDSDDRELSAAQQQFFKDSKVRDSNGNLMRVYHGTFEDFTVFNINYTSNSNDLGKGFYFTNNMNDAERNYSSSKGGDVQTKIEALAFDLFQEKGYTEEDLYDNDYIDEYNEAYDEAEAYYNNGKIISAYLNITNPLYASKNGQLYNSKGEEIERTSVEGYIKQGYDGIIDESVKEKFSGQNLDEGTIHYVAFSPEQVKSIDNLNPTSNPDIRYSLKDSEGNELSKEQQKYFKNSKVRDANENLKVMYHGTGEAGFTVFESKYSDDGRSFFFTDNINVAKSYSASDDIFSRKHFETIQSLEKHIAQEMDENVEIRKNGKMFELWQDNDFVMRDETLDDLYWDYNEYMGFGGDSANYKVYLNLENPLVIDADGNNWDEIPVPWSDDLMTTRSIAEYAGENGYDGVMIKNVIDTGLYGSRFETSDIAIAFNSNQIKSVENKEPTKDPDIRFSLKDSEGNKLSKTQQEYFAESKIRDEDGNLRVVYHGSAENFTVFDRTKGRSNMDIQGMFFSPWEVDAMGYGENVQAYYLNIKNPAPESLGYKALRKFQGQNNAGVKARDYLESLGYDGVNNGDEEYIAFHSNQIKSVDNLNPTEDDDIRYSLKDAALTDERIDYIIRDQGASGNYARSYVAHISPRDFLKLTISDAMLNDWQNAVGKVSELYELDNEKLRGNMQTPYLIIDSSTGDVIGHEGRHRMLALMNSGIENVSILVEDFATKYSKEPMSEMKLSSQDFGNGPVNNGATAFVRDLYPTNDKYREDIRRVHGTGNGLRYSFKVEEDADDLPVAYDIVERFVAEYKTNNQRSKYQLKDTDSYAERKVAKLEDKVAKLRSEFKRTYLKTPKDVDVNRQATRLIKKYDSNLTLHTKLVNAMRDIFKIYKTENANWDEAYDIAEDIARQIVDKISILHDESWQEYKDLRTHLKNVPMRVSEADRASMTDYSAFRKANFGRIKLTNDQGLSVDQYYQELVEQWPDKFTDDYVTTSDQLYHIADVLDSLAPWYETYDSAEMQDFVTDIAADIMETAYNLQTRKTFADRKAEEKAAAVARVKAQRDAAMDKLQERYEEKLIRQKKVTRDKMDAYKEKQKDRASRKKAMERLQKSYKWLNERLLNPSDTKHIPESYRKVIAELLSGFDFETDRSAAYAEKNGPSKKTIQFMKFMNDYSEIMKSEEGQLIEFDPDIIDTMNEIKNAVDGKRLADLDTETLDKVSRLLKTIQHQMSYVNRCFSEDISKTISELGEDAINGTRAMKKSKEYAGMRKHIDDLLNQLNVTPSDMFELIGGPMKTLYQQLRKGMDRHIINLKVAKDYVDKVVDSKKMDEWSNEVHKIQTSDGALEITTSQIMSLYALMQRKQAQGHILGSGIVMAPVEVKDGKGRKSRSTRKMEETKIIPELEDVTKIISMLTDEQIEVADQLRSFLGNECSEWGNRTSMKLYGYKKFTEKDYFPIKSSNYFLNENFDTKNVESSLKNMGFTKAIVKEASNPIIIDDIFDVFTNHVSKMSMYEALVPAMTDFQRVYNYKSKNAEGKQNNSVQKALSQAFGRKTTDYIKRFMEDINGQAAKNDSAIATSLMALYKKASIGGNIRVLLQQPTAIVRAMAVMNPKYLLSVKPATKADVAEMQAHCPIAQWKSWGFYNTDVSRSFRDIMFGKKNLIDNVFIGSYGKADDFTWACIWKAVKKEVADNNPDLEKGSDEYWQKVNERASYVFDRTQVVDSVFHRSQIMRNKGTFEKMVTAFMAEPTKTYNMMRTEIILAQREKASGQRTAATERMGRVLSVYMLNALAVSMAAAIADAMRGAGGDDDEDKGNFLQRWWAHTKSNFVDNANPLNLVPYVKDVVSLYSGYDVARMDTQAFSKLLQVNSMWEGIANGTSKYSTAHVMRKTAEAVSYFTGLPVRNVLRDAEGIVKGVAGAFGGGTEMRYLSAKMMYTLGPDSGNRSIFADLYYDALAEGNSELANEIRSYMISKGVESDYIKRRKKTWDKKHQS